MEKYLRLSADVGGTFTDVVLEDGNQRWVGKVLTTPEAPEQGVMAGIDQVLAASGRNIGMIGVFIHGTTLATNAVIERRGARTALIATDGFRDILEIGTENRYDQYELALERPRPLIPRSLRHTVRERMDAQGRAILPLIGEDVRNLARILKRQAVESVAVAFLHSYANPAHEEQTARILAEEIPGLSISLSSRICPEIREYERTSTTAANAYVQPLISGYLGRLGQFLGEAGFTGNLFLITSGGALLTVEAARSLPVRLIESGPAGGAVFAARLAAELNEPRILAFDMGGTTAKITLIENFRADRTRLFEVDRAARFLKGSGLPLRIPVVEMVEIGAGGGSIAGVDALRRVTVGPVSASSVPGPACYGRGGRHATVTDADLALGLLDPGHFAGGTIGLDLSAAIAAIETDVAAPLGLDPQIAAYAIHEIVCDNMATAAHAHVVERGRRLDRHAIVAFGGAAPLHVARLAEKLGVARVIVPPLAGVGSAVGMLRAPVSFELVKSLPARLSRFNPDRISELLEQMSREVRGHIGDVVAPPSLREKRLAFMRYVGQGHEITVEIPVRRLQATDAELFRTLYEEDYRALFGQVVPDADIEVVGWSVHLGTDPDLPAPAAAAAAPVAREAPIDRTIRMFDGARGRWIELPAYRREQLRPGDRLSSPSLVLENETTTFVSTRFRAHIDIIGSIVMERDSGEAGDD
ncbi:hydantoinase/oxoprolinase family protein [Telmatospirillum siberiense]|nr:hydantoinase/oxoprolinase family protein [Telmatospirillum siberiense]